MNDTDRTAEAALRESQERQAFLLKLSDALRPLAGALDIQREASRLLRQELGADRVTYWEVIENEQAAHALAEDAGATCRLWWAVDLRSKTSSKVNRDAAPR